MYHETLKYANLFVNQCVYILVLESCAVKNYK